MTGRVHLNGTTITVKEILREEMPLSARRSQWTTLYEDVLLRLEELTARTALRYELPASGDARKAKHALCKRFRAASREDVELVAVTQNGHSVLFVGLKV